MNKEQINILIEQIYPQESLYKEINVLENISADISYAVNDLRDGEYDDPYIIRSAKTIQSYNNKLFNNIDAVKSYRYNDFENAKNIYNTFQLYKYEMFPFDCWCNLIEVSIKDFNEIYLKNNDLEFEGKYDLLVDFFEKINKSLTNRVYDVESKNNNNYTNYFKLMFYFSFNFDNDKFLLDKDSIYKIFDNNYHDIQKKITAYFTEKNIDTALIHYIYAIINKNKNVSDIYESSEYFLNSIKNFIDSKNYTNSLSYKFLFSLNDLHYDISSISTNYSTNNNFNEKINTKNISINNLFWEKILTNINKENQILFFENILNKHKSSIELNMKESDVCFSYSSIIEKKKLSLSINADNNNKTIIKI